ncbi:MAG: exosortase-associated EpsI family protein [Pseudomonadota bacterium]
MAAEFEDQLDRHIAEIKAFLTGQIPDGILFRVSSIDPNAEHAYARQHAFVAGMVTLLTSMDLNRLTGLTPGKSA